MKILIKLLLFTFYLLIIKAKINKKINDNSFNIQSDSNENLFNDGINSEQNEDNIATKKGNKKFGKNQKEGNKELDIQSEGFDNNEIPSKESKKQISNFGDNESEYEKEEDNRKKKGKKGMIEKYELGRNKGRDKNERNKASERFDEQNQDRNNQRDSFDSGNNDKSQRGLDSGTLDGTNNLKRSNDDQLPEFLKTASLSERQKFLQLEAENDRSKSSIRRDKQNWADQQGQRISDLYKQFQQSLQQKEKQFKSERQRNVQIKLSRNAQNVDKRIQDLLNNPDIAERALILQIEQILGGTDDSIRQELQRQISVIGPLDGNIPPNLT